MLSGGSVNLKALSLVHVIPSQGIGRCAVATLGNEMFVVSSNSPDIEVYDAGTFALQCHFPVPGLGSYCDSLAACIHNSCLYASDTHNNTIHRVDLSGSKAVTKWSVAREPTGLSVNKAHNVVVTCSDACKLQEYTTHGTRVREISLRPAGLTNIMHAVQLSTGDYVVSHCKSFGAYASGAVSVVGLDGQIVCRYGGPQTSNVHQMIWPRCLAVTKYDEILVADASKNRILLIDTSQNAGQVLALPVVGGLQLPCYLFLDESRGRLYVIDNAGRRLLVFENKPLK